jgi:maltooligosyltrehalose trehalohydrolase
MSLGAELLPGGRTRFTLWAPDVKRVSLLLEGTPGREIELAPAPRGYHEAVIDGAGAGTRYRFRLDDRDPIPDPASRFQPEGIHGPSEVVDPAFPWTDAGWTGLSLERLVFYEIHVGTFTREGGFDAVIPRLDDLKELGVTALELMPVAQFPGTRNWGYDGAAPFAVQNSYGGPRGLKGLVDACHRRGLAVVLDVVYNHLGPEGNYLWGAAPYFTDRYRTPWGAALNFDGPGSDEVRRYFIENALRWLEEFHVDALRLDAVHAIVDPSARTFLEDLSEAVAGAARRSGRSLHLVAESDRNDPRLVRPLEEGGIGMDAVWNDDFHHALHVLLTGEREGYYEDFGLLDDLGLAMTEGFVISGRHSSFRKRRHGASSRAVPARRFVVCAQNHDQIGNRARGERLSVLVPYERQKLAAGVLLLSPGLPLLFMGEEYGETAPFLYFTDHGDPALVEAVRKGRREEFSGSAWAAEVPDPQDAETFARSRPDRGLLGLPRHQALRELHRTLLALRRGRPALAALRKEELAVEVDRARQALLVTRGAPPQRILVLHGFSERAETLPLPARGGRWEKVLDSADPRWHGPGALAPGLLDLSRALDVSHLGRRRRQLRDLLRARDGSRPLPVRVADVRARIPPHPAPGAHRHDLARLSAGRAARPALRIPRARPL